MSKTLILLSLAVVNEHHIVSQGRSLLIAVYHQRAAPRY